MNPARPLIVRARCFGRAFSLLFAVLVLLGHNVPVAAQPVIDRVSPNPAPALDGRQDFMIYGRNFQHGANVILRDLRTGEVFTNRPIASLTSTSIMITPWFTSTAAEWSVEVINPDSRPSGQYRFQVGLQQPPPPQSDPPVLTDVSPDPAPAIDARQDFTITGRNFQQSANIILRDLDSGELFTHRTPKSLSNTQIVLTPWFTSTPAQWTVEVINPDGQSTGQRVFTTKAIVAPLPSEPVSPLEPALPDAPSAPDADPPQSVPPDGRSHGEPLLNDDANSMAPNVAAAKEFIERAWPGVLEVNPSLDRDDVTSDHAKGLALDVFVTTWQHQAARDERALGDQIAHWFIVNQDEFGTAYVIWFEERNYLDGGGWQPYTRYSDHPNNNTLQHRDHVHISFERRDDMIRSTGTSEIDGGEISEQERQSTDPSYPVDKPRSIETPSSRPRRGTTNPDHGSTADSTEIAPVIDRIWPANPIVSSEPQGFILYGANFDDGTRVRFRHEDDGRRAIAEYRTHAEDKIVINVRFRIPGMWIAEVVRDGRVTSEPFRFRVAPANEEKPEEQNASERRQPRKAQPDEKKRRENSITWSMRRCD